MLILGELNVNFSATDYLIKWNCKVDPGIETNSRWNDKH